MYSSNSQEFEKLLQQGYQVNIGKYLNRGADIFKQNWGSFFCFFFAILFIKVWIKIYIPQINDDIADLVIGSLMNSGFTFVALKSAKGRQTSFADFFRGFKYSISILIANLLIGVFVLVGIICLILPGIYLLIAYMFTIPLIIEKKMHFWRAMEVSRKIITKDWFSMFSFVLILCFINLCGILLLIIGLLFTAPLTGCAMIAAYEDIVGFCLSSETEI